MNWKMYLMFAAPFLETVANFLKNKDANETGADDTAAKFLHYANLAIQAIAMDQPIPPLPAALASSLQSPSAQAPSQT